MTEPIWKKKRVIDWTCNDFIFYFIHCYNGVMVRNHPNIPDAEWQYHAKLVERTMRIRGNYVLRAMIDWVFEHYKEHPEWDEVRIGLVCGTSPLAEQIVQEIRGGVQLPRRDKVSQTR